MGRGALQLHAIGKPLEFVGSGGSSVPDRTSWSMYEMSDA
jgi:hypothetical protein